MKINFTIFVAICCLILPIYSIGMADFSLQWQNEGIILDSGPGQRGQNGIASDGKNGAFISWIHYELPDVPYKHFIKVSKINNEGKYIWNNPIIDLNFTAGLQIASDGFGGIIYTWGSGDIYAQKIDSNGNKLWGINGLPICTAIGSQWDASVCNDNSGGAYFTWADARINASGTYIMRISSEGIIPSGWEINGNFISSSVCLPRIISDNQNGVYIVWTDANNLFSQRVNSNGQLLWQSSGINVGAINGTLQINVTNDNQGNLIVSWSEKRGIDRDIYAQKIDPNGNLLWGINGTAVCTKIGEQVEPKLVSDQNGGAIICWRDTSSGIYAQRVNSGGTILWQSDGIPIYIYVTQGNKSIGDMVVDGSSGAIICWADARDVDYDIYAQRINTNGIIQWPQNGVRICGTEIGQYQPKMIGDNNGGAIVCWVESDLHSQSSVRAQYIKSISADTIPPETITTLSATTNEQTKLTWIAPGDDGTQGYAIKYELRYSQKNITNETEYSNALVYSQNWLPKTPGTWEEKTVTGLVPGVTYYFSVRAFDEANNNGGLSNINNNGCIAGNFIINGITGLPNLKSGKIAWGDYDNNSNLDVAIGGIGWDENDEPVYYTKIYKNNGNGTFTEAFNLSDKCSDLTWIDINRDGYLDLIIAEQTPGSIVSTFRVLRNDQTTFTEIQRFNENMVNIHFAVGDYDNDGDLDIACVGTDGNKGWDTLKLYRNDNGILTKVWETENSPRTAQIMWGDYDNDGDPDLVAWFDGPKIIRNDNGTLVPGQILSTDMEYFSPVWMDIDGDGWLDVVSAEYKYVGTVAYPVVRVYKNNHGTFSLAQELPGIGTRTGKPYLAIGDYDNDGNMDVAVSGEDNNGKKIVLIFKNNNGILVETHKLQGVSGCLTWADYDGDNDLDLICTGASDSGKPVTLVYKNTQAETLFGNKPNSKPVAPTSFNSRYESGKLILSWGDGTDNETVVDKLLYNLRVSTFPGWNNIVSGVYGTPLLGNYLKPVISTSPFTLGVKLNNLSEGKYYWSVKTIDTGLKTSDWATEQIAYIDFVPPTISTMSAEPDFTPSDINTVFWSISTDVTSGVAGYVVQSATSSDFSTIFSSAFTSDIFFTFTNLSDSVTYFYRVKAQDNAGNESGWSNVVWSTQDNSAPNIKILAPIGTILAGLNTIMVQSINEPLPSTPTVKITLNGAEPQDITLLLSTTDQGYTWSCLYTIPKENKGEGYLEVRAIDRVGYLGYSTGTFIVVSGAVKGIEVFNLSDIPDPYIPDGITLATFTYTIDKQNPYTVQWSSLTIFDPFDNFVKQYTKTSSLTYPITYNEFWDGKNMTNNFVGDGIYHYQVNAGGIRRKGTSTLSVEASTKTATITILKRINFTFVPVTTYTNPSNPTFIITPMTSSDTARVFGISSVTMDRIIGAAYRIEPSSVIISPAATLTLYYDDLPLGGINPVDLRIYRFEPGQPPVIISNATDVDIVNKKITVHLDRLSTFAILSPGAIFIPPEKIDTTPPTFAVNLTFDSEKTDEITVTVIASEKLQAPPSVTVYPHGKSEKKLPINVDVTLVEGTKTIYTGTFTRITGFGDIDKVIVIGKDLAGNIGISDGTFTKNVISSTGGIVKDSKGKGITVDIPEGAIQEQIIITINEEDQNNALVENEKTNSANKCNLKRVGKGYKFGPDGTQFAKPVTITIPYTGENVKNTDLTKLKIACWNESKNNWDIVKNSKVYPQENKTTAEIMHFSVYQIVIQQEPDSAFKLGEIYSYPNPAKGGIQPILHIEVGLADRIEIMVYNIAAELVHSTELMGTTWKIIDNKYCYEYTWNASGVASGVYIYMVRAKKGNETIKVLKKLAIIR